jgi:hypothetical protein
VVVVVVMRDGWREPPQDGGVSRNGGRRKVLWTISEGARTAQQHLLRISGARKSVVAVTEEQHVCLISRLLYGPGVEIRNRADPREHGAVFSMQHLFCSIRGNAILDSHSDLLGASL